MTRPRCRSRGRSACACHAAATHRGSRAVVTALTLPALVLLALVAGCSSRTEPWPSAAGSSKQPAAAAQGIRQLEEPTAATESARPLETRSTRPIPEVISRPQPFQLPPAMIAALSPLEATAIEPIEFPSSEPPTTAEVRGTLREYVTAMKRRDVASLVAHWSESGESVDLDSGETIRGRDSIGRVFASLFERDSDADVDIDVTSVRPIREAVAVVDGVSTLACPGEQPARSRFSAVLVKEGDRWLIDSVRESSLPVEPEAEVVKPLAKLRWLLGHWENFGRNEQIASTHCFWSARDAYLVRSHTIAREESEGDKSEGDKVVSFEEPVDGGEARDGREITEIIGWDPVAKSTRSWIFSSDGGFGEATWTLDGDRLVALVDGTLADGSPVSGTLRITKLGPDELSCELAGDGLDRLLPPAGDFLRTARAATRLP